MEYTKQERILSIFFGHCEGRSCPSGGWRTSMEHPQRA